MNFEIERLPVVSLYRFVYLVAILIDFNHDTHRTITSKQQEGLEILYIRGSPMTSYFQKANTGLLIFIRFLDSIGKLVIFRDYK